MIRYRYVILMPNFTRHQTYKSVNEVSAFLLQLRETGQRCYIEVQAYDDKDKEGLRAWTNETILDYRWFEAHHDELYQMIEDYGTHIDALEENELREHIAKSQEIRYSQIYNIFLLIADGKLFRRVPNGRILEGAMDKQFHKAGASHWKRHTQHLFPMHQW